MTEGPSPNPRSWPTWRGSLPTSRAGVFGPIDRETRFFADLGLASIDAVVLGEMLQEHYGRPLPFGELMAELGRREDRDLTRSGELAGFPRRDGWAITNSEVSQA